MIVFNSKPMAAKRVFPFSRAMFGLLILQPKVGRLCHVMNLRGCNVKYLWVEIRWSRPLKCLLPFPNLNKPNNIVHVAIECQYRPATVWIKDNSADLASVFCHQNSSNMPTGMYVSPSVKHSISIPVDGHPSQINE